MRAILLLNGYQDNLDNGLSKKPTPLSAVADRPFIFHIIESLAKRKITTIHIVEYPSSQSVREVVNTGDRWGVTISYHLAEESKSLSSVIKNIARESRYEQVVFGFSVTLPDFEKEDLIEYDPSKPILFFTRNDEWAGWGILRAKTLEHLPSDLLPEELPYLLGKNEVQHAFVNEPYSTRSVFDLYEANVLLLNEDSSDLLFPTTAHQVEQGIWISRNVAIHPSAKLIAPVYIGENSRINEGTVIGPGVVIEKNCLIDRNTQIRDSVISAGSYVGVGLEVDECVIDKDTLTNIPLKTVVEIQDDFILGGLNAVSVGPQLITYLKEIYGNIRTAFDFPEPRIETGK